MPPTPTAGPGWDEYGRLAAGSLWPTHQQQQQQQQQPQQQHLEQQMVQLVSSTLRGVVAELLTSMSHHNQAMMAELRAMRTVMPIQSAAIAPATSAPLVVRETDAVAITHDTFVWVVWVRA
jgi:hypothetical protein